MCGFYGVSSSFFSLEKAVWHDGTNQDGDDGEACIILTKHDKKRKVSSLKETCLLAIALSIKAMLILVPLSIVIAPFFIFLITALTDHPKRNTAIFVLINVLPNIVDIETIMESELNMINSITDYKIELPQIRIAWIVGFPSALAVSSLMLYSDAEAFVKKHRIRERIRFL